MLKRLNCVSRMDFQGQVREQIVCSPFSLQCRVSELQSILTALHNEGARGCLFDSSPKAFISCQVSGHHVRQRQYPNLGTVLY